MTRRWILPALATAVVIAVLIGGVLWLSHDDGPTAEPTPTGTPTVTSSTTTSPSPGTPRSVTVYYLGDQARGGPRLFSETHQVPAGTTSLALAAVNEAIQGPGTDPDYRTAWPQGSGADSVTANGSEVTINLTGDPAAGLRNRPAGMSVAEARISVEQIIWTVKAAMPTEGLGFQFLINGNHTDQVLGVPASEPLAAGSGDDVLAAVSVSSPASGATIPAGKVTVTGMAATFEANVVWEVRDRAGSVVRHGFTTAAECCTQAPYSFDVTLTPGDYVLTVHDSDESGAGRPVNSDTKAFTVE